MCSDYKTRLVIKSNNSNNVIVGGYATVFNLVDSHGDTILKGAFKNIPPNQQLLDNGHNIKLLWQHDSAAPIGLIKEIFEDEFGVQVEAHINPHIQKGQEAIALVQQGVITNFSVGFTIDDAAYNTQGNREIKSATLWEVSLVTFPANQCAKIYRLKTANIENNDVIVSIDSELYHSVLTCLNKAHVSLKNLK